ncbi:MAG: hypothetical protein RIE77_07890 [Phycisphaerales bacterium]|jgi:hypothetical protein
MKNVDETIRSALSEEDRAWFDSLGEQSPIAQVVDSFTSLSKTYLVMSFTISIVFMGIAVFSAVRFFLADDAMSRMPWMGAFFVGFLGVMLMKIGYWMELSRVATTRELKRVELQVARLAEHVNAASER